MNILNDWKKKLLFGYYNAPLETCPEMEDDGFSFRLFAGGTVIYQTYSYHFKTGSMIRKSGRVTLSEATVSRITRILAGYAKEIDALPEYTNNGSNDGSVNDFVFCGKFISTMNIRRNDLPEVMRQDPRYYEDFRFDMADENTILDIFTRITEAMRQDGVELYLNHLIVKGEKIK